MLFLDGVRKSSHCNCSVDLNNTFYETKGNRHVPDSHSKCEKFSGSVHRRFLCCKDTVGRHDTPYQWDETELFTDFFWRNFILIGYPNKVDRCRNVSYRYTT